MNLAKETILDQQPLLGFRFSVFFYSRAVSFSKGLDFRFSRVSGIGIVLDPQYTKEGGTVSQRVLTGTGSISNKQLTLERGMPVVSPSHLEINDSFSNIESAKKAYKKSGVNDLKALEKQIASLQPKPADVLVSLLNDEAIPVSSWLFKKAKPISWSLSDFNATSNEVVVETIELSYERMTSIQL